MSVNGGSGQAFGLCSDGMRQADVLGLRYGCESLVDRLVAKVDASLEIDPHCA